MLPENMKLKIINKTSHQFRIISKLMKRKDINKLVVATDAGCEGELVARRIMKLGGWGKRSFKRLWISSQTDSAILAGFSNLQPGKIYNSLFASAVCRSEADWLIGLNVTRALTCKYDISLNAGRVQTPTLSMIVDREKAIREFKPVSFWNVIALFGDYYGIWRGSNGSASIFDYDTALKIVDKIRDKKGSISNIAKKIKSEPPPFAYDLAEIQRDANIKFGFSAKKTLSVLQSLYEKYKLITYPRTDSRFITSDMVETLPDRIKSIAVGRYKNMASPLLQKKLLPGKRFVYNVKVSDHHAIIPTEQVPVINKLSLDEKYIYDLVVRRFLAVLYPDYRYEQTAVITTVEGEKFYSHATVEKSKGWKSVGLSWKDKINKRDNDLPEQIIGDLHKGEERAVNTVRISKFQTKPPERFTDATLITAMEDPGRYIDEDKSKNVIKYGSLGTSATRADIIEKLISNFYIHRRGKKIIPSSKAFKLIDLIPSELKTPELTAEWELRLLNIEKGDENPETFIKDIRKNAEKLVKLIRENEAVYDFNDNTKATTNPGNLLKTALNDKGGK
jgi:DNA topoisomerase-3